MSAHSSPLGGFSALEHRLICSGAQASLPWSTGCSALEHQLRDRWLLALLHGGSVAVLCRLSCCSIAQSCPTLCDPMDHSTPDFPVHHQLLELAETRPSSNHLTLCRPLLLPPSIFPSIRVFSNELILRIRWSFSFSISPSNECSGLISFRMDWLDCLAVQVTLKGLLQHRSSKASILRCSAFFMVQLSHLYMTAGKTRALTIRSFVGKVIPLLFNALSRFFIAFVPRSKYHFILIQRK